MNIDKVDSTPEYERILRTSLKKPAELRVHEEQTIKEVLTWCRGDSSDPPSLIQWLSVCRIIGEDIAVQLDAGDKHHYLRFDKERNRVVLVDPADNSQVPIEETDVQSLFQRAVATPVTARAIQSKTYEVLTAVSSETSDTKIALGRYENGFVEVDDQGEDIHYEAKVTFELPEAMTADRVEKWLASDESESLKKLVLNNEEQNWDNPSTIG